MFGRYDDDWNDEETIRTYLFTSREFNKNGNPVISYEFEGTSEEVGHEAYTWAFNNGLDHCLVYELVEYGQLVPMAEDNNDSAIDRWLWSEDM